MALNNPLTRLLTRGLLPNILRGAGGGGGGAFDAEAQGTLSLWLDGTVGVTEDGFGVIEWLDQSTKGNDVVQVPFDTHKPQTSTMNGLACLHWTTNNQALIRAAVSVDGMEGPSLSIFAAVQYNLDSGTAYPGVIHRNSANWSDGWKMHSHLTNGSIMNMTAGNFSTHRAQITAVAPGAGVTQIYGGTHEAVGNVTVAYLDNVQTATTSLGDIDVTKTATHLMGVGNFAINESNGFKNGKIGEILVYEEALGETERTAIFDYLAAKWGVP